MAQAILYEITTGRLTSIYEGSSAILVAAQNAPAGEQLLELETDLSVSLLHRYVITESGVTAKTPAVLTASRTPFPPDEIASCTVTLDPFVPCTILVNGAPTALTEEDPTLVLTSDVQASFVIALEWHPTHWADAITVLAQTWVPLQVTSSVAAQDTPVSMQTSILYRPVLTGVALVDSLSGLWTSVLYTTLSDGVVSSDVPVTLHAAVSTCQATDGCPVASTVTIVLPVLSLAVTDGTLVADTLSAWFALLSATVLDGVQTDETLSPRLPRLVPAVTEALPIQATSSLAFGVLSIVTTAVLSSSDLTASLHTSMDLAQTTATCTVQTSVALHLSLLRQMVTEPVGVQSTVTGYLPVLRRTVTAALTVDDSHRII